VKGLTSSKRVKVLVRTLLPEETTTSHFDFHIPIPNGQLHNFYI
jgi:hypothetical protein